MFDMQLQVAYLAEGCHNRLHSGVQLQAVCGLKGHFAGEAAVQLLQRQDRAGVQLAQGSLNLLLATCRGGSTCESGPFVCSQAASQTAVTVHKIAACARPPAAGHLQGGQHMRVRADCLQPGSIKDSSSIDLCNQHTARPPPPPPSPAGR